MRGRPTLRWFVLGLCPPDARRVLGDASVGQERILVQVTQRAASERVPPALPAMFGCVVKHVAALA